MKPKRTTVMVIISTTRRSVKRELAQEKKNENIFVCMLTYTYYYTHYTYIVHTVYRINYVQEIPSMVFILFVY